MNPYHLHTDMELVDLFVQGDNQAFEEIYFRYAKALYRFARKNVQSGAECEEMVHDVFESLIVRRTSLQIESLKGYLFTAIRYMIIRHIQKRDVKRKFLAHFNHFMTEAEEAPAGETVTAETLLQHLGGLPERCQEAIRLRIVENLSNSEIAQRMNINKRTAELYISKAFSHLRACHDKIYKPG